MKFVVPTLSNLPLGVAPPLGLHAKLKAKSACVCNISVSFPFCPRLSTVVKRIVHNAPGSSVEGILERAFLFFLKGVAQYM